VPPPRTTAFNVTRGSMYFWSVLALWMSFMTGEDRPHLARSSTVTGADRAEAKRPAPM
jgi:hypothetical protein